MAVETSAVFRFADIEFQEREHRATRAGRPLPIEPKAFRLLLCLLQNSGHLVTKEELLHTVWGDTAVTENSLTRDIALLRRILEDDPHQPRFIETVSTAGYRFICPVETCPAAAIASSPTSADRTETHATDPQAREDRSRKIRWIAYAAAGVAIAGVTGAVRYELRPLPMLRIAAYTQITNDGQWKRIAGMDGSYIYLNLFVPNGQGVVSASGGHVVPLPLDLPTSRDFPNDNPQILNVSPDGSKLLVGSHWNLSSGRDLWVFNAHTGEARYLAKGYLAAWSPDSGTVAYSTLHGALFTIPSEGGDSRLLLTSSASPERYIAFTGLVWSPDGSRIRFTRDERYWEISAEGKNPHELLPNWHASNPKFFMGAGHWTPDGDFFLFVGGSTEFTQNLAYGQQIWALDERRSWLHRSNPEPFELTNGAIVWGSVGFALSWDGRTVYSTGMIPRGELVRYDGKAKGLVPYFGGISAEYVNYSKDGKHLVYVTVPEGEMWRANRDGSGRMQLTKPTFFPVNPEWSPDGTQILFFDMSSEGRGAMYTMSSQGGTPKRLLSGDEGRELFPDWSPDGKKIVFQHVPAGATTWDTGTDYNIGANNRILELDTGKLSDLPPCPKFCMWPRWSPNGRYILTMTVDNDLAVFDFRTDKWSLFNLKCDSMVCPRWSPDSRSIYFGDYDYPGGFFKSRDPGIYRVPVTGGKAEKVIDLSSFRDTVDLGGWIGVSPDNSLLFTRQAGTYDIYALALERK